MTAKRFEENANSVKDISEMHEKITGKMKEERE